MEMFCSINFRKAKITSFVILLGSWLKRAEVPEIITLVGTVNVFFYSET
jgi:hypothetical protein